MANLFKSQAVGDMTPLDVLNSFLVEGLRVDRKIPHFQVPRPNGIFLGSLEISNLGGGILIIKK